MSFFHFMYFKASPKSSSSGELQTKQSRFKALSGDGKPHFNNRLVSAPLLSPWNSVLASGQLPFGPWDPFPREPQWFPHWVSWLKVDRFFRWATAALGYTAEHWIPFWKGIPFSSSPPGACTETGFFNRCISLISRCIPYVHFGFVAVTRFGEELRTLLQTRNVLCSLWCAGNKEVL